jgi:hypothetical protein
MRIGVASGLAVAWALVATGSRAAPSGLALMPTCDLVPPGEVVIEAQADGTFRDGSPDARFLNTELGITTRLELGVDYDASDGSNERWLGNGKWVFWEASAAHRCAAFGLRNWGDENEPEGYLVGCQEWGALRGHAGATCSEANHVDALVGADYEWSPGWWGYAEWTSGPENSGSAGINAPLPGPFDLIMALLVPNASDDEVGYSIHLVCSAPVTGLAKTE